MFSAGPGVFSRSRSFFLLDPEFFFAGAGAEKPGVCTALTQAWIFQIILAGNFYFASCCQEESLSYNGKNSTVLYPGLVAASLYVV